MDEMNFCWETLALVLVLTGRVEVKLQQLIEGASFPETIPSWTVNAEGMGSLLQNALKRAIAVIQWCSVRLTRQVNWGLLTTLLTNGIGRIKLGPLARTSAATIVPVCTGPDGLTAAQPTDAAAAKSC